MTEENWWEGDPLFDSKAATKAVQEEEPAGDFLSGEEWYQNLQAEEARALRPETTTELIARKGLEVVEFAAFLEYFRETRGRRRRNFSGAFITITKPQELVREDLEALARRSKEADMLGRLTREPLRLEGSVLYQLPLRGFSLQHILAQDAEFRACDLELADLSHADLQGSSFGGIYVRGASDDVLYMPKNSVTKLSGACLNYAQLQGADLSHVTADELQLHYADLTEANLEGSVLTRAGFNGTVFTGVRATAATIEESDLRTSKGFDPEAGYRSLQRSQYNQF